MDETLARSHYLASDSYSLADAAATPYVNHASMLALDGALFKGRPHLAEWFNRIKERSSFQAAIENYMTNADWKYFRISRKTRRERYKKCYHWYYIGLRKLASSAELQLRIKRKKNITQKERSQR